MVLTTARCAKALQLTLAVIKPDAVAHPLMLEALHQKILDDFIIVKSKEIVWRRHDSERFYAEHKGRFFYQRLVEFMSSGPMWAYILAREEAVSHWRTMMGPTKVFQARHVAPGTLRACFGLTDTRNTTHGSDSEDSARREIAFFFPEFSVAEWMERAEPAFRAGPVEYDPHRRMHTLLQQRQPEGPLETDPQHRSQGPLEIDPQHRSQGPLETDPQHRSQGPLETDPQHRSQGPLETDPQRRSQGPLETDPQHRSQGPLETDPQHRSQGPLETDPQHRSQGPLETDPQH